VICVRRLSKRESEREFQLQHASLSGACREHRYYSVVPIPSLPGRLPKGLHDAVLARLLRLHEESGVCDCREHGPCDHGRHR
jgi:hypothetical protein